MASYGNLEAGDISPEVYNALLDRLAASEAMTRALAERVETLRDDNAFLRSNVRDLETRNRELVLGRVKVSFSERLEDRSLHFHLVIDNIAVMYARDPRIIVEGAFRRIGGELDHFIRKKDSVG